MVIFEAYFYTVNLLHIDNFVCIDLTTFGMQNKQTSENNNNNMQRDENKQTLKCSFNAIKYFSPICFPWMLFWFTFVAKQKASENDQNEELSRKVT